MFEVFQILLRQKKYLAITLIAGSFMAMVSYYLMTLPVSEQDIEIYAEMNGYLFTFISLVLGLISSILFGFYVSLLVFQKNLGCIFESKIDKRTSSAGVAVNIIASGCPSCGVPALTLIGMPFALEILPFRGIELKLISIVFLLASIYYLSGNIKKSVQRNNGVIVGS